MSTVMDMLTELLQDLKSVGSIEATAIISRDGLLIASDIPSGFNAETFAAMSATMLGAAETATAELDKGVPDRVIIESENAKLIAVGAGQKALLVVLTPPDIGLGLVLMKMEKTVDKVKKVL